MGIPEKKCVMTIDSEFPLGITTNTATIVDIALSRHVPKSAGSDAIGKTGNSHLGIIRTPVSTLKADREKTRGLCRQLYQPNFAELIVVNFPEVTQVCNYYDGFTLKASQAEAPGTFYCDLVICGPKRLANKLTGGMSLMRQI